MRRGSPLQSLAASPTMVGAITTLIVIVAVFLAYNANNGLPFVPVYRVSVEIPNSPRLVPSNEVRIGGDRVGVVESIEPTRVSPEQESSPANRGGATQTSTGSPSANQTCCVAAKLNLKLDQSAGPLPEDSIFRVRYRSSFGLKYVEITRGTGDPAPEGYLFDGLDDSGRCQLPTDLKTFASTEPASAKNGCFQQQTEFDAINDTFNTKTRTNARENLVGYGDAFAARGASLNDAIEKLRPLFENLKPVSEVLSDPSTQLRRFIVSVADTARIVAPVAVQQADFFGQAAVTFEAISSDPAALRGTISEGAPLLEQGPAELRRQRPFLSEFAKLSRRLNPGVRQLRIAIPTLNDAIQIGTPVLNRTPPMNHRLREVLVELNKLVQQPSTKTSLERLKTTFDTATPLAEFVAPAQTVCNYGDYWTTFFPEHISERDQVGFLQRVAIVNVPKAPAEAQVAMDGYSGVQSNGLAGPVPNPADNGKFEPHTLPILHGSPYGPAGQPSFGQYPDCQPGQQGYPLGNFPIPGQAKSSPSFNVRDIPGSRGVTDVFFKQNGDRVIKDTRIPSHQP
jgi:phospholipid/cholesterol/gamma-HCH transport system substrate-binding protein